MDGQANDAVGGEPAKGVERKVLPSLERRVLGVLVEKAKTVPDAYPMTLNGIVTGCNQKSNRSPQMTVDENQVETAIESLRRRGAMIEVHGTGRVPKFKHYAYEWLGVDKVELAVMTELLLRGEQTLGDLRIRASRMEPIADLPTLQGIVARLIDKGLMQELTPPGRGQLVSHALYTDAELERLKQRTPALAASEEPEERESSGSGRPSRSDEIAELQQTVRMLEERIAALETRVSGF